MYVACNVYNIFLIGQIKKRKELLSTITLYLLIVCISLSSHISLLNEWQSLSKRTQLYIRYNHEHHECKENVFHLWIEDWIKTSLYRISSMKSRTKTMCHNQTAQTLSSRVYLSITRWIEAIDSLLDNTVSISLFQLREAIV